MITAKSSERSVTSSQQQSRTVASLGWVSPGAATEGVTPIFFLKKTGDLFVVITASQFSGCHRCLFSPEKLTTFLLITVTLLISLGCHPPGGRHYRTFLPIRPRLSTIHCKYAHIFSFGCHPLDGVTRGGPPPPPGDATGLENSHCSRAALHDT